MRPTHRRAYWLITAIASVLSAAVNAAAAEKPPFYQGKSLNIVINFGAGGPTDIESRIFARHLSRHIPGAPTITVQNMGGGGGLTAVNYIGEVAKPDGFTAAYFTGSLFQHQIKDPALRVDIGKFGFITGVHGVTVSYIRTDVPPGIKKPSDFVKAQKFRAAGLGVSSSKDVRFRLSFDLLGLKYDYVTGYNNSSDARLAVQRNEAQYHDETLPSYRSQVEPQMVKTGMVTPIYYTDLVAPSGEILASRDVPELQPFTYYYKEIFGKLPSGIKYEALKAANMSSTNMTRMKAVEVGLWPRKGDGVKGALCYLDGDDEADEHIVELSPGGSTAPVRHLYTEAIYVVSGHGSTSVWRDPGTKQTFEWGPGSYFVLPTNAWLSGGFSANCTPCSSRNSNVSAQ